MVLFFENRELVTPGDLLAKGDYLAGENVFRINDEIYATRIGLVEYSNKKVSVVALKSFYVPSVNDIVIGKVVEVGTRGWMVEINSPFLALLRASDAFTKPFNPKNDELTSILDVGDVIIAKIIAYDRTRDPLLTIREHGLGKVKSGQIVVITPTKIPRVIGRKGSMISMIKNETGCNITIGQNGVILVRGKNPVMEGIVVRAIKMIEKEAHTTGLTDRVTDMIRREKMELKRNGKI
ncbi:RNA-binding protein [Candidatus Bathyarchaeota archaeon B24-2]|nr:MAG: RNA-binding protein [Candidatus Bathyarchaeota archaeon B24-2]